MGRAFATPAPTAISISFEKTGMVRSCGDSERHGEAGAIDGDGGRMVADNGRRRGVAGTVGGEARAGGEGRALAVSGRRRGVAGPGLAAHDGCAM